MESMESEFRKELVRLINKHSLEQFSNTPDFILAEYLEKCLAAYDVAVSSRDKWFNINVWTASKADGSPGTMSLNGEVVTVQK